MKKLLSFILVIALCLTAIPAVNAEAAVKLNKKSLTLTVGEKYTLKVTGAKSTIKWSSIDTDVATVSNSGVVKCVGIGFTIISATVKRKTYKCKIHVEPKDKNVLLRDDDFLKLTYVNTVDGIVYLRVLNKTDDQFSFADEYLILDGTTYSGSGYCSDVPPNYTKLYEYESDTDISSVQKLSGKFTIFGDDGITIEDIEIKDIIIE